MTDLSEFTENDNVGWVNPHEVGIPADLPEPAFWRITVMPVQPKRESAGGILLPVAAQDAEEHLQIIGMVVAIGPLAFRSWRMASGFLDYCRVLIGRPVSWAPKVGDWVVYGRYTGLRTEYRDTRLVVMNDDEIISKANGPSGFKVYL